MRRASYIAAGFAILVGCLPAQVLAAPVNARHVQVELLANVDGIQAGHDVSLGLRFALENGWHVYWQNPGDSGEPPSVRWTLPRGFSTGNIEWPTPKRIPVGPLVNFGYDGTVLLPIPLRVPNELGSLSTATIEARAKWLVCDADECIPGQGTLSLSLPITTAPPSATRADLFERARSRMPVGAPSEWDLTATTTATTISLSARTGTLPPGTAAEFFPYARDVINASSAQTVRVAADGFQLDVERLPDSATPPQSLDGVLTIGARSYGVTVPVRAAGFTLEPLLLALAGGLLLNLMPCVFPVLAIKALALISVAGNRRRHVRTHGLLYALGVLVSFWILAGVLLAVRAQGEQLGWGFQLQSPAFIAVLASLFFWMALILLDLSSVGGSLMGVGHRLTTGSGHGSAFFTGVLATVVATPCAAPFMGAAIGYALIQPAPVALGVFTFLGLGLALPYVVITFVPTIAARLPRPGAWMETVKQLLAFPLLATVVWLIWVASLQAGPSAVITILAALLMLSFAVWLAGHWRGRWPKFVAGAVAAAALAVEFSLTTGTMAPPAQRGGLAWEPYSSARVAELVRRGTPVFVDFTAAWCVTCQVNERLALATTTVSEKMRELGVVAVRADWTTANADITRALQQFGRDGVPLYVLYSGRDGDPPRILPQLLTPEIVVTELEQLKTRSRT